MKGRTDTRPVLACFDGSPGSEPALVWAAQEARLRGRPLVVCHTWCWPYPMRPRDDRAEQAFREAAKAVVDDGVRRARALDRTVDARPLLVKGAPAAGVLTAARDAALIVVGSRGQGGFEGLAVGSVAVQLTAHATCPVVVVRSPLPEAPGSDARIVVGVDGSPSSEAAVGFALEEAMLRDASVTAICGWWDGGAVPGPPAPFAPCDVAEQGAKDRFGEFLAPWRDRFPRVPLRAEFLNGSPRRVMVDAAENATLLVLGDRGIGSAPQQLLGPVTQAALHRASCPVAVVRPT